MDSNGHIQGHAKCAQSTLSDLRQIIARARKCYPLHACIWFTPACKLVYPCTGGYIGTIPRCGLHLCRPSARALGTDNFDLSCRGFRGCKPFYNNQPVDMRALPLHYES